MLRFYSLAVVIVFFLTVNFYLIVRLLLISPEVSDEATVSDAADEMEVVAGGVDGIALAALGGDHVVSEEGEVVFEGTAIIVNAQGVPVEQGVVTLQLVAPDGVQIDQFVSIADGSAEVTFTWNALGSYRIEVLDVIGDGYSYAKHLNEVRVITGRAVMPEPEEDPTF